MTKVFQKNFLKILIFINLISNILTQTCNLRYYDAGWNDEWRLILYTDHNNHFQLLRGHTVPICKEIIMVCHNEFTNVRCLRNQEFEPRLPMTPKCEEARAIKAELHARTYSICPHTMYEVGYSFEWGHKCYFLVLYKVCFDLAHLRPIFTINTAYPKGGERPDFQFNWDNIFGDDFYAFTRPNTFKRFKRLLGEGQTKMQADNENHIINRGHLTPSADFTLFNYKHATFQMINVIPQFKTIDNGNWRKIEIWARHRSRTPAKICTGVLTCNLDNVLPSNLGCVLKLQNVDTGRMVPMFLANYRRIPIPLWIYKIVNYRGFGTVFLTLNNIYHEGAVQSPPNVCQEVECPLDLHNHVHQGFTFCCDYNHFIQRNVPLLRDVC